MLETICEWKEIVNEDIRKYNKEPEGFKKTCNHCTGYDVRCEYYTTLGNKPREVK